ncbi:hypothetical protein AB0945_22215 [Streptomyces sp. NPDC005474]|uniref:hypothetical protein n=1 Tax=Streptomyces sp. NPDC005474 TaxID=3154878 RepID=UPI003454A33F
MTEPEQPRVMDGPGTGLEDRPENAVELSPAAGETPAPPRPAEPPVVRNRRILPAVLRWTTAVAVFAAVGAATAYAITGMARTDVPGLATESDGRWTYPRLVKPPLPSGSPGPFAVGNVVGAHYADLRALVLPAPEGAREDKALRGSDGWLAAKDYLAEYQVKEERDELGQKLVDNGLRHIAARGWTTPDGIRTRIYLLQFDTANVVETAFASDAVAFATPNYQVRGAAEVIYDEDFPETAAVSHVVRTAYVEEKPYGPEQVRQAYLAAGDVFAVILQSRAGTAEAVPFQQTVILQSQLLG